MSSLRVWESHELVYRSLHDHFSFLSKTVLDILPKPQNIEVINTITVSPSHNEKNECIKKHVRGITTLSDNEQSQLFNLLNEYQEIFNDRPGCNKLYTCRFEVIRDEPFKIRPYPKPFSQRPAVLAELNRMLEWGVIERSSSPYASPIICIKKSDGTVRLCLDARRINQLIVPTRDTSPPLDELLARFHGKTYFSIL